ncbi:MAG TPA: hypothetical protein VF104_10365, partial [Burkholderiales bacterium]
MKTRLALTLRWLRALALTLTALVWTGEAQAQLPPPGTPSQFDITGFLQEATLDPACTTGALCGGTLTVNGHVVTVPANTIVILPANALTWQELFAEAPAPYTGAATGMALADLPAPLTTYEVHVTGNRVNDSYIAGLVSVSQQALNSGQGYVTGIDYANGELQILNPSDGSNLRVRINDPIPAGQTTGKFSKGSSPDVRFTIDEDNPTIRSTTGFPMCLPRVAPPAVDELCPQGNRPIDAATGAFAASFTMPDPATIPTHGLPDPRIQAPFEIGDYVTFAGTLVTDNAAAPTAGPYPGTAATYISAHTITNNIAIYTWPNTNPAYVAIDVTILGTGGTTAIGATEAAVRTRFEGFSTDPSRIVHLYGIDLSCADGTVLDNRDWGTIDVDPGPPLGAVKGRWRFRPPSKVLSMPAAGIFLPATREVRAVIERTPGSAQVAAWVPGQTATAANGIIYGQYHAPIGEYLFPEQIVGNPVPPANFETMPFLAQGGYTSSAGTLAGQLAPWPGSAVPPTCAGPPPVAKAGATPSAVFSGSGTVTLDASASTGSGLAFSWVQNPADVPQVTLTGANTAQASFT